MMLTFNFREFAINPANAALLAGHSAGVYESPMYWSMVLRRMRGTNETFVDFYKRIETEWSLTIIQRDFDGSGVIAGVEVEESMLTAILLKYPPKASSLPT